MILQKKKKTKKDSDTTIKGIEVIKDHDKNTKCTNCEEPIAKTDKRLVHRGSYHGLRTTEHYCIKCAKMLLRKIMIELH